MFRALSDFDDLIHGHQQAWVYTHRRSPAPAVFRQAVHRHVVRLYHNGADGPPDQARLSMQDAGFRLGIFTSSSPFTVAKVIPMLQEAAQPALGIGDHHPLFSDASIIFDRRSASVDMPRCRDMSGCLNACSMQVLSRDLMHALAQKRSVSLSPSATLGPA